MAYTTVDSVAGLFPTFKRGTPQQNPPDSLIQTFIDDVAGEIDAVLLRRFAESISQTTGLDGWRVSLPRNLDVQNLLEKINRYGAAAQLSMVLASYGVAGTRDLAKQINATYERLLENLNARDANGKPMPAGPYDHLFDPLARTESPRPLFGGIAGGETDGSTARDRDENKPFSMKQVF